MPISQMPVHRRLMYLGAASILVDLDKQIETLDRQRQELYTLCPELRDGTWRSKALKASPAPEIFTVPEAVAAIPNRQRPRITIKLGRPKRTPHELAAIMTAIVDYVKAHPAQRIEQINKGMNVTTAQLALPIRQLIAKGVITYVGDKRSRVYYVAKHGMRNGKARRTNRKSAAK